MSLVTESNRLKPSWEVIFPRESAIEPEGSGGGKKETDEVSFLLKLGKVTFHKDAVKKEDLKHHANLKHVFPRDIHIDGKVPKKLNLFYLKLFQSLPHKAKSSHKHSFGVSKSQSVPNQQHLSASKARRVGKARPGKASVCGELQQFPGCCLPELILGLSAARLASTHTLCASGRGRRAASVCTGPGGAWSAGTVAGRGRAGLTGGSWPLPGAALLGPGREAPERRTRGGKTWRCTRGTGVEKQIGTLHRTGGTRVEIVPLAAGATWRAAGRGTGFFAA